MKMRKTLFFLAAATVFATTTFLAWKPSPTPAPQAANMTFFVTSAGPGNSANLGGLAGADAHCQRRADAASRIWLRQAGLACSTVSRQTSSS